MKDRRYVIISGKGKRFLIQNIKRTRKQKKARLNLSVDQRKASKKEERRNSFMYYFAPKIHFKAIWNMEKTVRRVFNEKFISILERKIDHGL